MIETKHSPRILAVDDIEDMHGLFRALFREWQLDADYAFDGQEAVDKHAEHPYDLILMNANMPVMMGEEAIAIIRDRTPDVPIIAISGIDYMLESIREQFPHRLIILQKPFRPSELKWLIRAFLELVEKERHQKERD